MPRISPKTRERFQETTLDGFVVAGQPNDFGVEEEANCCVCGSRIKNVFLTNYGPMGGDCLATLTGDDSTRKEIKSIMRRLQNTLFEPLYLVVEPHFSRPEKEAIVSGYFPSHYSGSAPYRRLVAYGKVNSVKWAIAAWSEDNPEVSIEWRV